MTAQLLLLENNTLSCLLFLFFPFSFTTPLSSRKACEAVPSCALIRAVIHGIAVREGIAVFTVELKDHCRDVLIAAGGGGGDVFNIQSENLLQF